MLNTNRQRSRTAASRVVRVVHNVLASPQTARSLRKSLMPEIYSTWLICSAAAILVAAFEPLRHWFLLPVIICGIIMGGDAVRWITGRISLFDASGLFGLFGLHFFFVAPILQIVSNYRTLYILNQPDDWRPWLGFTAVLNCLGLVIYKVVASRFRSTRPPTKGTEWRVDFRSVGFLSIAAVTVAVSSQLFIYFHFDGIMGYMAAFSRGDSFKGYGWAFLLSESAPLLATTAICLSLRRRLGWLSLAIGGVILFGAQLLSGGLRGSRSNTVFVLVIAAGMVHVRLRRLSLPAIAIGVATLGTFMYLYAFYKEYGLTAIDILASGSEQQAIQAEQRHRTVTDLMLGDFGRADVQALILYRYMTMPDEVHRAWGRTYLGAVTLVIPRSIWPDRPDTKTKELTEFEYGVGSYVPGYIQTSHVAGLAGEAMLNFGLLGAPLSFVILGILAGWCRRLDASLGPGDTRRLFLPVMGILGIVMLVSDLDNDLVFLGKYFAPALLLVYISSIKERRSAAPALIIKRQTSLAVACGLLGIGR